MKSKFQFLVGITVVALVSGCTAGDATPSFAGDYGDEGMAPRFEVNPLFPQPLPNHWLVGPMIGVTVDARDHIWVVHRNTEDQFMAQEIGLTQGVSECCQPGPPVLEFDQEGNLISSFGGPSETGEYDWPTSNHGLAIDNMGNIWIGGNGQGDSHILKFTRDGRFLMQVGEPGQGVDSNSMTHFSRVTKVSFDQNGDEAFIGDGYGNKRVVVVDAESGEFLRYWGAYGNRPDDADLGAFDPDAPPAQQFRGPVHCAEPSNDGLVYVCDRTSNRVQVFEQDGTYVNEIFVEPRTRSAGSTWEIAFSPDEEQRFMYLADGLNRKVHVLDRKALEVLYSFGDGGRQPGQFYGVHSIETDSKGNIYTTETWEGKRLQKFVYLGMGRVEKGSNLAALWPTQD